MDNLPKKKKKIEKAENETKISYLKLFLYFLKVGFFTFGGGYAIISVLQKDIVEKYKWLDDKEMLNMMAVGESTPGAISLNMATFIGYRLKGFWGSVLCTLAFMIPSFAIISIISLFIEKFLTYKVVNWMFRGIRAGVIVLIGNAFFKFLKQMDRSIIAIIIFLAGFFVSLFTNFNVIYIILIGGGIGLIYVSVLTYINKKRGKKDDLP